MKAIGSRAAGGLLFFSALLFVFYLGHRWRPILIPRPMELWEYIASSQHLLAMASATAYTSSAVIASLALASAWALPLGVVSGLSGTLRRFSEQPIDFLRSIPPSALIPAGILIVGTGVDMFIGLTAWALGLILVVLTRQAIVGLPAFKLHLIRTSRLTHVEKMRQLLIPAVLPSIESASRILVSLAMALVVVCEIIVGDNGVGATIRLAQLRLDTAELYVYLLWTGLVGSALNWLVHRAFDLIEYRLYRPLTFEV